MSEEIKYSYRTNDSYSDTTGIVQEIAQVVIALLRSRDLLGEWAHDRF